jgi:hypothetical protein
VFKLVTIADDKYGYQRFPFADEWALDAGATEVSLIVPVWCAAANTASVGLYGTNLGLQESDQHTGGSTWEYLKVEGVTLDAADTALDLRLICDTGTAFFGPMTLCIGPKAVMLKPRGLSYHIIDHAAQIDLNATGDVAWSDSDCTGNTDNLAVLVQLVGRLTEANGTAGSNTTIGHSDDLWTDEVAIRSHQPVLSQPDYASGTVMCNDSQVVRYQVQEADADNDCDVAWWITGMWTWE